MDEPAGLPHEVVDGRRKHATHRGPPSFGGLFERRRPPGAPLGVVEASLDAAESLHLPPEARAHRDRADRRVEPDRRASRRFRLPEVRGDRLVLAAGVRSEQPLHDPDVVRVLAQALEVEPHHFVVGAVEGGEVGLVLEVEHFRAAGEPRAGAAAVSRQRHLYRPFRH